jgi:putative aldouronate transport system substrate-binding protein
MYMLAPAWKAYPELWVWKGNSIAYGGIQPEMREVVRAFADWYQKGYLRKDFMTLDSAAVREDVVSGKTGIQMFYQWWGYGYGVDMIGSQGLEAYFDAYEMPSADSSKVLHPMPFDNEGYLVINKNCKNIDAAIKCISYVSYIYNDAVQQGIMTKEELFVWNATADLHTMLPFKMNDSLSENQQYIQVQAAIRANDPSVIKDPTAIIKYEGARNWIEKKDPTGFGFYSQLYGPHCAYNDNDIIIREKRMLPTATMGPPPEELNSYGSTLSDILLEGFTKIVIGDQPLSYFDTVVAEWKAAGGDNATAAVNRDYGKR